MKLVMIALASVAATTLLACSDLPTSPALETAPQLSVLTQSSSIVIGAPGNELSRFPFGGALGSFAGTRFQQAYAASSFGSTEPLRITSISFLGGQGTLAASTYSFYLSTVSAGVDNLSETDFDANRGADNVLFASADLSGPAPATLTIVGTVPFDYDPTKGNLLLDIVVSPRASVPATPAFYAGRGDAFGVFSRYQNFGFASIGSGLVTEFGIASLTPNEPPQEVTMAGLLNAVAEAVAAGSLNGAGPGNSATQRLNAWRNMLYAAQRANESDGSAGCAQLQQAYLRADGQSPPPDFVAGDAAAPLAAMILELRTLFACN